jgi:hypothetical protein
VSIALHHPLRQSILEYVSSIDCLKLVIVGWGDLGLEETKGIFVQHSRGWRGVNRSVEVLAVPAKLGVGAGGEALKRIDQVNECGTVLLSA